MKCERPWFNRFNAFIWILGMLFFGLPALSSASCGLSGICEEGFECINNDCVPIFECLANEDCGTCGKCNGGACAPVTEEECDCIENPTGGACADFNDVKPKAFYAGNEGEHISPSFVIPVDVRSEDVFAGNSPPAFVGACDVSGPPGNVTVPFRATDANGDAITYSVVAKARNVVSGTWDTSNMDALFPSITYESEPGFFGQDMIAIMADDGKNRTYELCAIHITGETNPPPIVDPVSVLTVPYEGQVEFSIQGSVRANVTFHQPPAHKRKGSVSSDGTNFFYTAFNKRVGSDQFVIEAYYPVDGQRDLKFVEVNIAPPPPDVTLHFDDPLTPPIATTNGYGAKDLTDVDYSDVAEGLQTFYFAANDAVWSNSLTNFEVIFDRTPPALSVDLPDQCVSGVLTGEETFRNGLATDNIALDRVEYLVDNANAKPVLIMSETTTRIDFKIDPFDTQNLSEGIHTVTIKAYDAASPAISSTLDTDIHVDNITPVIQDVTFNSEEIDLTAPIEKQMVAGDVVIDITPFDAGSVCNVIRTTLIFNDDTILKSQSGAGDFQYTLRTNNGSFPNGDHVLTVEVEDEAHNLLTQDIPILIINVPKGNGFPTAVDDAVSADEEEIVLIPVLDNDTDPNGDPLSIESLTQPESGLAEKVNDEIRYTPDEHFNGSVSFTYVVSDGQGGTDEGTVVIEVNPVNDPPHAFNDSVATDFETAATIDVLANDVDVDGDVLTLASVENGANGKSIITDGKAVYTPDAGFVGEDTFSYTITDGHGGSDSATVTVTVGNLNNTAPEAEDDAVQIEEDGDIVIQPLINDTDADGDPLSIESYSEPTKGDIENLGNGRFSYTPGQDLNGADSFTYVLSDGQGGTDSGTVFITIQALNDNPNASNDSVTTLEDEPVNISVLLNDTDVDGDALAIGAVSGAAKGDLLILGSLIAYDPFDDQNGLDSFTYELLDGNGGADSATVTVSITPVNDNPVAADDSTTTSLNTPVDIVVVSNDSDVDGDFLTIQSVGAAFNGSVHIKTDQTITYTPADGFSGVDSFSYVLEDGNGGTDSATVTIGVNTANNDPLANPDEATVLEDEGVLIDVLLNDTDEDGDALNIDSFSHGAHGSVTEDVPNQLTYTPEDDFNGTDSFTYVISDGQGGTAVGTVDVVVTPVNDDPVASPDSAQTTEEASVFINVKANDADVDGDPISLTSISQGSNGTTMLDGEGVSYLPSQDFTGTDSFTYEITDGNGGSDSATVNISVAGVNDDPVATDDNVDIKEDEIIAIDVLANDVDADGDILAIVSYTDPLNGTVAQKGTILKYTPEQDFSGTDSLTYTIEDGKGGSDSATISITLKSVNDNPEASPDLVTTDEDTSVVISPLLNDVDVDGDALAVESVSAPSLGSVVLNGDQTVVYEPNDNANGTDVFDYVVSDGQGGSATGTIDITIRAVNDDPVASSDSASTDINSPVLINLITNDHDVDGDALSIQIAENGSNGTVTVENSHEVTYAPDNEFAGTDTFSYVVQDGNGGTDTAVVTVGVANDNQAPLANDDAAATTEDSPVILSVLDNDTDPDSDPIVLESVTQADHGTVVINEDNTVTYSPEDDFNGSDAFAYVINDGQGASDSAAVSLSVEAQNDPPVAIDDAASTEEDETTVIDVLANDSDVDGEALTIDNISTPANGTAVLGTDNKIEYDPVDDFNGTDAFTYRVVDGNGESAVANVTVTVAAVNDAPTTIPDAASTDEETAVLIAVLDNDSDAEGDTLTIKSVGSAEKGSVVKVGASVLYTPFKDEIGADQFTYTVQDGNGGTGVGGVTVAILPVNDPPVANNDAASTNGTAGILIDVLQNDTDPDSEDTLSIHSYSQGAKGTVSKIGDQLNYVPLASFDGTDNFTYTIKDQNNAVSNNANVKLSLTDTQPPVVTINQPLNNTQVAGIVPIGVSVTDNDQIKSVQILIDGLERFILTSDPFVVQWNTAFESNGEHRVDVEVTDRSGNATTQTVTVMVNNAVADDPPSVIIQAPAADEHKKGFFEVKAAVEGTDITDVQLFRDGDLIDDGDITVAGNIYTYGWNSLSDPPDADGLHKFKAIAFNGDGLNDSDEVSFHIDNQEPVLSFISPEEQQVIFGAPVVLFNAFDNLNLHSVEFLIGTTKIADVLASQNPMQFQFDTNQFPDGEYVLVARPKDRAGNVGRVTRSISINNTNPPQSTTQANLFPIDGSRVTNFDRIHAKFDGPIDLTSINKDTSFQIFYWKNGRQFQLDGEAKWDPEKAELFFTALPPHNTRVEVNLVNIKDNEGKLVNGRSDWFRLMDADAGGTVSSFDGLMTLSFDPDVLPEDAYIEMILLKEEELPVGLIEASNVFLGINGRTLAGPYEAKALAADGRFLNQTKKPARMNFVEPAPAPDPNERLNEADIQQFDGRLWRRLGTSSKDSVSVQTVEARSVSVQFHEFTVYRVTSFAVPAAGVSDFINFPNPFSPQEGGTEIQYSLGTDSDVKIIIYDLFGNLVRILEFAAGTPGGQVAQNIVSWDGKNGEGDIIANGGYIAKIVVKDANGNTHTDKRKMGVVK